MEENKLNNEELEKLTGEAYFIAKEKQVKMVTQKLVAKDHQSNIALMIGVLFGIVIPQLVIIIGSAVSKTGSDYVDKVMLDVAANLQSSFTTVAAVCVALFVAYSGVFTTLLYLLVKTARRRSAWAVFLLLTGPVLVVAGNLFLSSVG